MTLRDVSNVLALIKRVILDRTKPRVDFSFRLLHKRGQISLLDLFHGQTVECRVTFATIAGPDATAEE